MDLRSFMLGLTLLFAFISAVCLFPTVTARMKRVILREKTHEEYLLHSGLKGLLLRRGILCLKPVAQQALKNKAVTRFMGDIEGILEAKGYSTNKVNIASLCSAVAVSVFCIGSLSASSVFVGVLAVAAVFALICIAVKQARETRKEALRESIPDALRSMGICFHVGYSLQQTFEEVAKEASEPLASVFRHAVHDLKTGKSISEALDALRRNSDADELAFISVAFDVQHRAGGSLKRILDAARNSVESELELKRNLKVQTAQAKLSARIVSVVPFVLITAFSFLSPGFLDPFFRSPEGMALLGLAGVMQLSGILMVRRLLNIEVGEKVRS